MELCQVELARSHAGVHFLVVRPGFDIFFAIGPVQQAKTEPAGPVLYIAAYILPFCAKSHTASRGVVARLWASRWFLLEACTGWSARRVCVCVVYWYSSSNPQSSTFIALGSQQVRAQHVHGRAKKGRHIDIDERERERESDSATAKAVQRLRGHQHMPA